MRNFRVSAYLELSVAAILVGSSVVAGKIMTMRMPVFLSQAASLAIALLVLIPLVLFNRTQAIKVTRHEAFILLLQAFLGMFMFRVLTLYGLKYASAAEAGIVTSLTPAVMAILSVLFLKERLSLRLALGIGCSMLGLIVIQTPGLLAPTSSASSDSMIGILLILLAVIGEAMLTVLRKKTSNRVSSLLATTYITFFSFLMFLPFSLFEARWYDIASIGLADLGLVTYGGIFVTVLGYLFWFRGVSNVTASSAAVFTGFIPVSTLLLSYGILHETLSFTHIIGIASVFIGIALITSMKAPPLTEPTTG